MPATWSKTTKIPWAFPDSDYTYAFDMQVAYCAAMQPTNFVARRYRIKWGTDDYVFKLMPQISVFATRIADRCYFLFQLLYIHYLILTLANLKVNAVAL